MRRLTALTGVVLAGLLAGPSSASAWFVDRGLGGEFGVNQLIVIAAPGETNRFHIGVSGTNDINGTLYISDRNFNPVTYGSGCGPPAVTPAPGVGTAATCGSYAMLGEGVSVTLADGDDQVEMAWPFRSNGFPDVHVTGDAGNDSMMGGEGISTLEGGPGNDVVGGEDGCCSDPLEGGNDVLTGGPGDDRITGGDGSDVVSGGEGNDLVRGDIGVVNAAGADRGGDNPGADTVDGGPGDDDVRGDDGFDTMLGSDGIDRLDADDDMRDNRIDCGPGLDRRERVFYDQGRKKAKRDPKPISCKKAKKKKRKKT